MATQDSIDKIINIRFNYKELVQGWVKANEAIEDNKKILADLKKSTRPARFRCPIIKRHN